jgi:F0F1-type ATP synthase assembly protein I
MTRGEDSRRNSGKGGAWRQVGRYTSLAFVLPSCVFVGYIIGHLLDNAFGTTYLMPVFLLIGIAAGFVELIREVQKDAK